MTRDMESSNCLNVQDQARPDWDDDGGSIFHEKFQSNSQQHIHVVVDFHLASPNYRERSTESYPLLANVQVLQNPAAIVLQ